MYRCCSQEFAYRSAREGDATLHRRLRKLGYKRRRVGYRHWHILLRREGIMINRKKTRRIYRVVGSAARRRRKRSVGSRAPAPVLARPNQRWSQDFVGDQMASVREFRVLNAVDYVTRECLAAAPYTSITGQRVARELTRLINQRRKPGMFTSDNGSELTNSAAVT